MQFQRFHEIAVNMFEAIHYHSLASSERLHTIRVIATNTILSFRNRIKKKVYGLVTRFKGPVTTDPIKIEENPILEFFDVHDEVSTAGPGLIWHIYDATRKSDGKECSVFIFDKRLAVKQLKPKCPETLLDRIKICVNQLTELHHPKMLEIIHKLEEGEFTVAFASEPILGSLYDILKCDDFDNSTSAETPDFHNSNNVIRTFKNIRTRHTTTEDPQENKSPSNQVTNNLTRNKEAIKNQTTNNPGPSKRAINNQITNNPGPSKGATNNQNTNNPGPGKGATNNQITNNPGPSKGATNNQITNNPGPSKGAINNQITNNPGPSKGATNNQITNNPGPSKGAINNQITNNPGPSKGATNNENTNNAGTSKSDTNKQATSSSQQQSSKFNLQPNDPKDYEFLDFELRYGFNQIVQALEFVHSRVKQVHRNICPQVILINKKGTWKLFGLEFAETLNDKDNEAPLLVAPWSIKTSKLCQPSLNYMAPETQINGECSILSDMFSLGLLMCTVFNLGESIIQAKDNPILYVKQLESLDVEYNKILPKIPDSIQEALQRLVSKDPHPRPNIDVLQYVGYFTDVGEAISALQFLDIINTKEPKSKKDFYRTTLIQALPNIPGKLRWQHIWPTLDIEIRTATLLSDVLHPFNWFINESPREDIRQYMLPIVKSLLQPNPSNNGTAFIIENLYSVMCKTPRKLFDCEIMPLYYQYFDSDMETVQIACLVTMQRASYHVSTEIIHGILLDKMKTIIDKNPSNPRIIHLILTFYEQNLNRLERHHIMEKVMPNVINMKLNDATTIKRVVEFYKTLISEERFELTADVMATLIIPALAPYSVNLNLDVQTFTELMQSVYDMLENIDNTQRDKLQALELLRAEQMNSSPFRRNKEKIENPPPFVIPNLHVDRRKTSSSNDMARKHSASGAGAPTSNATSTSNNSAGGFKSTGIGQWIFGSNNSNNNFLRVATNYANRRLSDNTLLNPKSRATPSSTNSPGGTPGGTAGLPSRRHSSIGPQERRGSSITHSPPTGNQNKGRGGSGSGLSAPMASKCTASSASNASTSFPYLATSSTQSVRSRRSSAYTNTSSRRNSSVLQQITSGVARHLPGGSRISARNRLVGHWNALQGATAAGYTALQNTASANSSELEQYSTAPLPVFEARHNRCIQEEDRGGYKRSSRAWAPTILDKRLHKTPSNILGKKMLSTLAEA